MIGIDTAPIPQWWLRVRRLAWLGVFVLAVACGGDSDRGSAGPGDTPGEEGAVLRIVFERSGGFAGLTRSMTLDSSNLTGDEREILSRLIEEAQFFDLPAQIVGDAPVPDDFTYSIEVEAGDRAATVVTSDSAAPEQLRPLLDWLTSQLQTRREG